MVHPLLRTEPMAVPRRMLTPSALRAPIGSRRRRPAHLPPVNGPPPPQGVVASGTPPPRRTPSFGRFVSVGRPAAPPYTSKELPRSQGDSVPRSTVEKASTIRGTVASERRAPRDSISAKPSHAPVPASRRCASCRHASEGGTIGDHASGLPPGGLGTGRTRCPPPHPRAPAFATCRSRNVRRVLFRYP